MRKLRVGIVTPWDVTDPLVWSGVVTPMLSALENHCTVVPLSTAGTRTALIDRLLARAIGTLTQKTYLWNLALTTSHLRSRRAQKLVEAADVDVVLAIAASAEIAFLHRLSVPVVHVADATFALLDGFYPDFSDVHPLSRVQASLVEQRSTHKIAAYALPSQWVIDSLVRDYGVAPERCHLVPFGAVITPVVPKRRIPTPVLRVLLVSSNWERKGGDAAVRVVSRLRDEGHSVQLTVVGRAPGDLPDWVDAVGLLSREDLSRVYESSDVLLELAGANCSGVTLTDASAFGLPSVATNVGGVSSIIIDGQTGILVDSGPGLEQQAHDALLSLLDPAVRQAQESNALTRGSDVLNWDTWGQGVFTLLRETVPLSSSPSGAGH